MPKKYFLECSKNLVEMKLTLTPEYHFPKLVALLDLPYEVALVLTGSNTFILGKGSAERSPGDTLTQWFPSVHTHPFATVRKNLERFPSRCKETYPLNPPTGGDYVSQLETGRRDLFSLVVCNEGIWLHRPTPDLAEATANYNHVDDVANAAGKTLFQSECSPEDFKEYVDRINELGFEVYLHRWTYGPLELAYPNYKQFVWNDLTLTALKETLEDVPPVTYVVDSLT